MKKILWCVDDFYSFYQRNIESRLLLVSNGLNSQLNLACTTERRHLSQSCTHLGTFGCRRSQKHWKGRACNIMQSSFVKSSVVYHYILLNNKILCVRPLAFLTLSLTRCRETRASIAIYSSLQESVTLNLRQIRIVNCTVHT